MEPKVIAFKSELDNLDVSLTVVRVNVERGILRAMLISQARKDHTPPDPDADLIAHGRYLLATQIYPSLIAATVETTGFDHWPPSFDEYLALPEELDIIWEDAVYDLNPHWTQSASEKKAG